MSKIPELAGLPELSFTESLSLQEVVEQTTALYDKNYKEVTGEDAVHHDADPVNLVLKAMACLYYQALQYIEVKAAAEYLPTATGDALDHLAALFGLARKDAERASTVLRFTLAAPQSGVVAIPAGTRVRTESKVYFNTLDYAEIPEGETSVDVDAIAEEAGAQGNGIAAGVINQLVDPIPYVAGAENVTVSSGGTEIESDDSLTERIHLAPGVYSSTGTEDAYIYYARAWRNDVEDVQVVNPSGGVVRVYFLLQGGVIPTEEETGDMQEYLRDEKIRPMGDLVEVCAPEEQGYSIDMVYYIGVQDRKKAASIQTAVTAAVEQYRVWQRKMGRDINPDELRRLVREAGAKRMTLNEPGYAPVAATGIARLDGCSVRYGGLEDD